MSSDFSTYYDHNPMPKVLQLYLAISQFPVLSRTIRSRMRQELFSRGIISENDFEREVLQKAIESQRREGLLDPLVEESPQDWDKRVRYIRAHLTDFYFAYNLPHAFFEQILHEVLQIRVPDPRHVQLTFNPEIAPWDMLFAEGDRLMSMPSDERTKVQHHLREIIVVLIKTMVSDHLTFVGLAKEVFSLDDLKDIRARRIGRGKIGGKAAGMLLAWKLLRQAGDDVGLDQSLLSIPESWYVGADVFYEVHEHNEFHTIMNQKYRSREEIIAEYPAIYARYEQAELPLYIEEQLRVLMDTIGQVPLIFRSSSLLEDSFTTAFAGKYDSFFLPNQGTPEENFEAAKMAIMRIYASTLSPDALIYRQQMGLVDFDERMAILIQCVEGQRYGRYFFPVIAGVGYSRNPFRWNPNIRREAGLLRLVCGMGTRAVERADNDYPRMIALSHPHLRPETRVEQMRQYSQHLIDVLDLEDNTFKTLPIRQVIGEDFRALRLVAAEDTGQFVQPFLTRPTGVDPSHLVFTFDGLAGTLAFTDTMRNLLAALERRYGYPVDIEFAAEATTVYPRPQFHISLLQCRTLAAHESKQTRPVPTNIPPDDRLFSACRLVPDGVVEQVRYVVFVKPDAYHSIRDSQRRLEVGRLVGRVNEQLADQEFVLMGPGRWGSSDIHLGVKVSYADIYNTRALIEVAYSANGGTPEMAYGTHFFQDLVEAAIYPLALFPHEPDVSFNWDFFMRSPNALPDLLPDDRDWADVLTVIDVLAASGGRLLEIVMDADHDEALGYLRTY